jgi:nucleotide-binding universal stress UspA family protein
MVSVVAMTHRILVAVDLSDESIAALKTARALADARGATLAVVHVLASVGDVQPFFPQSYGINATNLLELERLAGEALERRVAEVEGCSDVERFVELGAPYAEIVRRAEAWNADLVVVGSRGRTGISRAMLGSVAEHVVRAAHCPVLVARPARGSGVVMAATDLSDPSLPAVARAAEEARLRGARLVVMHAMERSLAAYGAGAAALLGNVAPSPTAEDHEQMRSSLVTLLGDAMRRFGAEGEALVLDGGAVASVVRAVEEQNADLLVVGSHGRTGLSRLLLGSVAEKLVRLADCSVLVVRKAA